MKKDKTSENSHATNEPKPSNKKPKKLDAKELKIAELTADLQRQRADFENYRKRIDDEKIAMRKYGAEEMVEKLLPIFDILDRALKNFPEELADHSWAQGVQSLEKNLIKIKSEIGLARIAAAPGTPFDHGLMNAVAMDDSEGEQEIVTEEIQPGYTLNDTTLREAVVKVGRR